jgi:hypothetical protein
METDKVRPTINDTQNRQNRSAIERWGQNKDMFNEGFIVVPNRFFQRYATLHPEPLTSGEALFVLHLMTFKWEAAPPYPSYGTLAKRMGVTDKMVRRYAQRLQKKGYVMRLFRKRAPNQFDLTGFFEALGS